ncbi:hypothetical protein GCM10027590_34690 [Nocardiopsis nanhaiensis]
MSARVSTCNRWDLVQYRVPVLRSSEKPAREEQLTHRIASVATVGVPVEPDVVEMLGNRIVDNAADRPTTWWGSGSRRSPRCS